MTNISDVCLSCLGVCICIICLPCLPLFIPRPRPRNNVDGAGGYPEDKSKKVLLLGSGDTGKSTFFKQVKILSGDAFNSEERSQFKDIILGNVIRYIKTLCAYIEENRIPHNIRNEFNTVRSIDNDELYMVEKIWSADLVKQIKIIWESDTVQNLLLDRHKLHNNFGGDTLAHYMRVLDETLNPNWVPSQTDVLYARIKTTGITESMIHVNETEVRIIDVGGQRSERRKWVHTFEGVKCIVWFVPLIEYATACFEDGTTNRALESLTLFGETVNSKWFVEVPFILLFNKSDLLEFTLRRCPLRNEIDDFEGNSNDVSQVTKYFINKFMAQYKGNGDKILPIMINSLDTEMVQETLQIIADVANKGNIIGYHFKVRTFESIHTLFSAKTIQAANFTDIDVILR